MKSFEVAAPDFDLALTLDSGQTFHWEKEAPGFVGAIGERAVYVEQRGSVLQVREVEPSSQKPAAALPGIVARYFALDHPLAEICASLPDDPAMQAARRLLPRAAHHAPAALGMSRHFHHFLDEAGGAHPANFVRAAQAFGTRHGVRRSSRSMLSAAARSLRGADRRRAARLRAGLSGEESSRDRAARRQWRSRSRSAGALCRTTNCAHSSARCRGWARRWPIA